MIAALVAVSVTIIPGTYQGNYWVDSEAGGPNVGNLTIDLDPSVQHFIDDGVFGGPSFFVFNVDASGNVTVAAPYAVGGAGTLTFNTCDVTIDPGAYLARWFSSSEHDTEQHGPQTLALIPALWYYVDNGSYAAPAGLPTSNFYYTLDSSCSVTSVLPAAAAGASGATVTFNTIALSVNPGTYGGSYVYSGDNQDGLTGVNVLQFIDGLSAYIEVATQPINFVPGPATLTFTAATLTLSVVSQAGATPVGSPTVQLGALTVSFSDVITAGITSVTVSGTGQPPPEGFRVLSPPTYYDITTTASYTGGITICIDYGNAHSPSLQHFEGGVWVNLNGTIVGSTICGTATSLSPFAVFEHELLVGIDIKPGAYPNTINLGSNGVVPVAILSSRTFDARTVDPASLTLASASVRLRGNGTFMFSVQDVNGDGLPDVVVQFSTQALDLTSTDVTATLTGQTTDGLFITGSDSVRVLQ